MGATKTMTVEQAQQAARAADFRGLPLWYFPIMGCLAGVFDLARVHPVLYWAIPVVVGANLVLTLTVLRTRMRLMKALWRNRRTRLLVLGLVGVRFAVRGALGALGFALGTATGGTLVGVLMAVLGTVMAWGDQWLILRTLRSSAAAPATA
ncbi:hypothetical protein ACFV3R_11520 [Streptomyces sp. NPDC059740]|uniref:hypothetical protein n=1 Tax=Streptomyces sp. NPDC059740 TaxID=3346926 RepID=UPI00364E5C34